MSSTPSNSEFHRHRDKILTGTVLAIDPSSGAYNRDRQEQSNIGYALFRAGELADSGVVAMDGRAMPVVWDRLRDLHDCLASEFPVPDVLIIEAIRGRIAHEYLKWSVAVISVAVRAPIVLEMNVATWRSKVGTKYQKSDENDAISIGSALIHIVRGG